MMDSRPESAFMTLEEFVELATTAYRERRITQALAVDPDGSVHGTLSFGVNSARAKDVEVAYLNVMGLVGINHV